MGTPGQKELVAQFRGLHHTGNTLVLPNAWDCISAKIYEQAGFPAIATTSSGISFSCGFQDGEHIPPALMLEVIGRITRTVRVPVTADIEGGYAKGSEEKFVEFIQGVIDAGAVGINLEDRNSETEGLHPVEHQEKLIRLVRQVAAQKGCDLFINARTDAMMLFKGDLDARIGVCIARARAFEKAGADGIFIPFVTSTGTAAALKKKIRLPLNLLIEGSLNVAELKALKVNRISTGSKPILATLSLLLQISHELKNADHWDHLFSEGITYAAANKLYQAP